MVTAESIAGLNSGGVYLVDRKVWMRKIILGADAKDFFFLRLCERLGGKNRARIISFM
jgi:hypothetical protein